MIGDSGRGGRRTKADMRNPWSPKNPFMSAWRGAANRAAASLRGRSMAQAKRRVAWIQADTATQVIDVWSRGKVQVPSRKGSAG